MKQHKDFVNLCMIWWYITMRNHKEGSIMDKIFTEARFQCDTQLNTWYKDEPLPFAKKNMFWRWRKDK